MKRHIIILLTICILAINVPFTTSAHTNNIVQTSIEL